LKNVDCCGATLGVSQYSPLGAISLSPERTSTNSLREHWSGVFPSFVSVPEITNPTIGAPDAPVRIGAGTT